MPYLRRSFLMGTGALAMTGTVKAQTMVPSKISEPHNRIAPENRGFHSHAVEATITSVSRRLKDKDLAILFENCFPNTLDTTVKHVAEAGAPDDAYIITGDIDAMWLRDSSAQLWPYLNLAKNDAALKSLFRGLIARQAHCIGLDPYANAFDFDLKTGKALSWAQDDLTEMKPGVAERKWEIDSLCWTVRLAYGYWKATGDVSIFQNSQWQSAQRLILQTFRTQQRLTSDGPYSFQRKASNANDTLAEAGLGAPTRKIGLIHSAFRPSDDACTFPFLIPANHFARLSLLHMAEMAEAASMEADHSADCLRLSNEITVALLTHGRMRLDSGDTVWAYEVDGFGNTLFMDDANVPSLIAMPYLGACRYDDPVWLATRKAVLSERNPYFFTGKVAQGIGGPHVGADMIWPMALMMQVLTSQDEAEIRRLVEQIKQSASGTGFMHEAFHKDDSSRFSRHWFAWANGLFGEMILTLLDGPHAFVLTE